MALSKFRGAITALVTPMRDGGVDEDGYARLIERQIIEGIHGLVPAGTTGESATLTDDEHRRVVEICVDTARGRVPVIAGAGSSSTARSIELGRTARAAGADAILVAAPPYNRPNQEGLYRHFAAIAEAVDLPLIVYNVPSRTACDIATETVLRLAKVANVAGIKDATGDLSRVSLMHRELGEDFALISGDDPSCVGYCAQGGVGVISVTSNVAPRQMADLMDACLDGRWSEALVLQDKLIRLHKAMFLDASPGPAKFALAAMQLCAQDLRLPMTECSTLVHAQIGEAMKEAGV